ncbi:MAG TPA: CHAT domain-containing tetratricopeptide repeat protein [Candidatus Sulfotelmatobacter sp.]|nr:CHAT domain-containing tetratricopeptide repeat protein [Candidatus Sulfotelmatobacter sp.]
MIALVALSALALATPGHASTSSALPLSDNYPIFRREDSLVVAGRWSESQALLDSLLRAARASGNRRLELQTLVQRGGRLAFSGETEAGEQDLRAALKLAPQLRDTTLWCAALRALTLAYQNTGRLKESAPLALENQRLARAQGNVASVARADWLAAYQHLCEGQYTRAVPQYRSAISELSRAGLNAEALEAHVGLARAYDALGETNLARNEYQRVIAESAGLSRWLSAANAWNNLGNIEKADGDPTTALADWNRALPLYEQVRKSDFARSTRLNVAQALVDLGRYDEAAAAAESVLSESKALGDLDHEIRAWITRAEIRARQARYDESLADADSALSRSQALTPESRAAAELAQIEALRGLGRIAAARAQAAGIADRAGGALSALQRRDLRRDRIELELLSGHPEEGLRLLEAASADSTADAWRDQLYRSRCHAALGQHELAFRELEEAASGWERWRGTPGDPEWRESRGPDAAMLYQEFQVLIAGESGGPEREKEERRAFDAIQRFKARTLEERMGGRLASTQSRVAATLAWLQSGGLREGELFLDFYTGPDSAFACAASPRAFRWVSLGNSRELRTRIARSGSLFAARGSDAPAVSACDAAAASLGLGLLAGYADLVHAARRVIIAPDAELAGVPFGALRLEGRVVLADREVVTVPSATILRNLLPGEGANASGELLALAGGAHGADRLTGAEQEVRWLERNIEHVRVLENPAVLDRDALLGRLAGCDAVHVAAHTEVNIDAPWRSGIQLTSSAAPRELEFLRASTIASLRLRARLAVLSGCQSYGSRELFGEGVLGLSTAFLGAGVPSVVCTLWPVDDRATATFMEDFYSKLLHGETPAAALRSAQLETMARPETRHPRYWAGFVLVGKPESRLALRRRA